MVRTFRVYAEKLSDGRWKCIFCPHTFGAGTSGTRIRWHLSGVEGEGVEICRQVPKNVQEEALQACPNKKRKTFMSDSEMDEMIRELQQGAEGNASFAGAENHIDDMNGETIQLLADEVRPVIENSWGAIHTLSTRNSGTISTSFQVQNDEVAEVDPFDALRPSSSNINVGSTTSICPQAQNTEVSNLMSILEPDEMIRGPLLGAERNFSFAEAENHTVQTILRSTATPESLPFHEHDTRVPVQHNEDSGTQQEVGEERDFSGAEARNRIENRTGETSQHIQRSITSERPLVDEHESRGAAIRLLADEVSPVIENSWDVIRALSMRNSGTISTSFQVQNDEVAEADPIDALRPSSSNINVSSATSTSPQAQNTEVANLMSILEPDEMIRGPLMGAERNFSFAEAENHTVQTILRSTATPESLPVHEHDTRVPVQNNEDSGTQQEVGEERDFSGAEARNRIENRTEETSQHIQRCITPERPLVDEHESRGAAMQQLPDEMDPVTENSDAPQPLFGKLLSEWESRLLLINAMLDDAEQRPETNQAMKYWLSKLRDLAYDVEDILDEFQTEALTRKLKSADSQARTSTVQEPPPTFEDLQPRAAMPNGPKLQEIAVRWENIMKEKNDLGLDINVKARSNKANRRLQSTSLVKEPKVYGRENAKEYFVELLMKDEPSNSRYSVIPIVGMGGIGKTTLAQFLYNDKRLKFDYKAWVCVSDDFDITRLTKSILRGEYAEKDDFNVLQEKLKEKLHGKKFFIVLDDVWYHTYEDWTTLCAPFAAGAPGSKIIITTRGADVAERIGSVDPYMLKELPYDECLCLFAQHAVDAENFDSNPDLKEAGQKIVLSCKGLPLAAKTLGGLLRHKQNLEDWEDILNSDLWELSEGESVILSALKLSYLHLPSHLKRCFAYCAIFPKDYEFDENELVLLWMAEGFLQKTEQKKQGIELGHKYFKDLLSRSLFQECSEKKSRYVMHDLISDLAQSVSGEICFHLDDKKSSGATSYPKVRHLSFTCHRYDTPQRFKAIYEMESLRTFLAIRISSDEVVWNNLSNKVLDDLVPKLKCLRALSLAHYHFEELPISIGALKHLRYLNLSHTLIRRLPESLGELLNLQMLILCACKQLEDLPAWIGNLTNLRHLDINDTDGLQKMPLEICKLKNLRFMPKFVIGDGRGLGIGELMRLPNLQGQLHIAGLDRVSNIQDAKLANLKERKGLGELALQWSCYFHYARNESHEKQVLSSLEPHRSLEMLSIISYGGTEFPSWVGDPSFSKMVKLELSACRKSTSLPSLEKLPALKYLYLRDMMEWKQWYGLNEEPGGNFPKLVELTLKNCPMLIGKLPRCLPSLKKLSISRCPQLRNLPEMLPSLRDLKVEYCHEVIFRMVPNFPSLTNLDIIGISGLVGLQKAFVRALVALENLFIADCSQLKYLWEDVVDLDKLANLKRLGICYCEQFLSLAKGEEGILPYTLRSLKMRGCHSMKSLPDGMMTVMSSNNSNQCLLEEFDGAMTMMSSNNSNECLLEELEIGFCRSLKSFPRGKLPTTLKKLRIQGCEELVSEYWFLEGITRCGARDDQMFHSHSHLEYLHLSNLSLTSFPTGKFPTSLGRLEFDDCSSLKSLPSLLNLFHLSHLIIRSCHKLEIFSDQELPLPNLTSLHISFCRELRSLPNHMNSLKQLEIQSCRGLRYFPKTGLPPTLTSLSVRNCENLRQPISEWRLHTLTSLKRFRIEFTSPYTTYVDYFPDDDGLLLPTSLTSLAISGHENLKSISRGIQHLTSLEELEFVSCPKLHVLPKEGFPSTLGLLEIGLCPLLGEKCLKKKGDYWPIIAHIPKVSVW